MAAQILSFAAARLREPATRDWSRQELAEFYRVESALLQAGLALEGDRGLTDEGDPWFVFCRVDTGEVFIHFARVDGVYVVDGAALGAPARGRDFGALVRDLIASHPLATVRRPGSNVMMHPAALLIALVGAAFFHSGKAKAAEPSGHADTGAEAGRAAERRGLLLPSGAAPSADAGASARSVALDAAEVAAVLTGVAIGLRAVAAEAAAAPTTSSSALVVAAVSPIGGLRADRAAAPADALSALASSDARATLTVMAVFHDLARTAALSSAGAAAPVATWTASTAELAAPAPLTVPTALAAPSAASAAPPAAELLVVHLASGPLPQIDALSLVTADGALGRLAGDRVVHVDQLPALLSDLIAHGDLVTLAPAAGPPAAGGGGDTVPPGGPPPGASGSGSDAAPDAAADSGGHLPGTLSPLADTHHDAGTALPASAGTSQGASTATEPGLTTSPPVVAPPSDGGVATPPTTSVPAGSASDPTPVATPAPAAASAHDPRIDAAVLSFVNEVPDAKVVISGHEVVFYDPAVILGLLPPGEVLDSITWRLEDGSSISLIGTASELHAFHGLG